MTLMVDRRRAIEHALLALVPVLVTLYVLYRTYADGIAAVDFRHSFWVAGWRALHGVDPYRWRLAQIAEGVSFPYPAAAALLLAPWALVSSLVAGVIFTAGCLVAAPLALWLIGVRDWRVAGAVALWAPVVVGWQTANFTLPILVGIALLWRWREQPWVAAGLVACLISLKPIMAPLWLWLALTRRVPAASAALVIGILINALAWTILGWHELGVWWNLLARQGGVRDASGYSLIALASHFGLGPTAGEVMMICGGVLLLAVAVRGGRRDRDARIFGTTVLMAIVISPQIDLHYLALLAVPLALGDGRLGWMWLAPLLLWVCPATAAGTWQIVVWWALLAILAVRILTAAGESGSVVVGRGRALGTV